MRKTYIDVEQVGKHVRIRAGQTTFHSEEYFDEASARRAAKMFVKAVDTRPMRLTVWLRGEPVTKLVRKLWATGGDNTVVIPVGTSVAAFRNAYFDPAFESAGM
jgi:hypothetical protein